MATRNEEWRVWVTPKRTLLRNAVLSFLLISVPLFGSVYLLGIPNGTGAMVLAAEIVTVVISLAAYVRYRMAFVGVRENRVVKRSFLGRSRSVPLADIDSVLIVETFRSHAPDSTPQLLLRDRSGRRVLRMRGIFWSEKSMRAVATAIDRPLTHHPDPITTKEFFDTYPGSAYWFEDRPALVVLAVVTVFAVSLGAVLTLMSLSGIPTVLG